MERKNKLIVGLDWSLENHQVNIFNEWGEALLRFSIPHSRDGFEKIAAQINQFEYKAKNVLIAIETHHNQVVDWLQSLGYTIYVIAPSVVKGNRSRHSNAGAKSDERDADLLADILRTDRHRLLPWRPESERVQKIRVQLRFIDDLTGEIGQGRNRLEAQLNRYFPHAAHVFSELTTQIALKTLIKWPTPSSLHGLELSEFKAFCKENRYTQHALIAKRFVQLTQSTPYTSATTEAVFSPPVPLLAERLLKDIRLKQKLIEQLQTEFSAHPDAVIYQSIPGCGEILAPKLLAIFGDYRDRFPSPDVLRSLAGTCPATSQSGKSRGVFFRKACNREWRHTFHQVAKSSVKQSDWAATYFEQVRARNKPKSQAYRSLANRWVGIIWTLWQRQLCYDEALHMQNVNRYKRNSVKTV
jgi:transposase